MTSDELIKLIPFLKEQGVRHFSFGKLGISFFKTSLPESPKEKATEGLVTEKIDDVVVPQSLEEEPSMNYEKVLNWSCEPEFNSSSIPLTGAGE